MQELQIMTFVCSIAIDNFFMQRCSCQFVRSQIHLIIFVFVCTIVMTNFCMYNYNGNFLYALSHSKICQNRSFYFEICLFWLLVWNIAILLRFLTLYYPGFLRCKVTLGGRGPKCQEPGKRLKRSKLQKYFSID